MEQLLQEAYPYVYGYLIKLTGDEHCAQDLTQETMVKGILKIGQFKGEAKFSTWLVAIGDKTYRSSLRKKTEVPVNPEDLGVEMNPLPFEGLPRGEIKKDLEDALKELPDICQA